MLKLPNTDPRDVCTGWIFAVGCFSLTTGFSFGYSGFPLFLKTNSIRDHDVRRRITRWICNQFNHLNIVSETWNYITIPFLFLFRWCFDNREWDEGFFPHLQKYKHASLTRSFKHMFNNINVLIQYCMELVYINCLKTESIFSSFPYCPHVSWWKWSPKTHLFKNVLRGGDLWKCPFASGYVTVLDPSQYICTYFHQILLRFRVEGQNRFKNAACGHRFLGKGSKIPPFRTITDTCGRGLSVVTLNYW